MAPLWGPFLLHLFTHWSASLTGTFIDQSLSLKLLRDKGRYLKLLILVNQTNLRLMNTHMCNITRNNVNSSKLKRKKRN